VHNFRCLHSSYFLFPKGFTPNACRKYFHQKVLLKLDRYELIIGELALKYCQDWLKKQNVKKTIHRGGGQRDSANCKN